MHPYHPTTTTIHLSVRELVKRARLQEERLIWSHEKKNGGKSGKFGQTEKYLPSSYIAPNAIISTEMGLEEI